MFPEMSQRENWNNNLIMKLIDMYKFYDCLWLTTHSKYKCKTTREKAWKSISDTLGIDVIEVRRKMKNLISQFTRELKRCRVDKQEDGVKYVSRWFAYHKMQYLRDKIKPRKSKNGYLDGSQDSNDSMSDIEIDNSDCQFYYEDGKSIQSLEVEEKNIIGQFEPTRVEKVEENEPIPCTSSENNSMERIQRSSFANQSAEIWYNPEERIRRKPVAERWSEESFPTVNENQIVEKRDRFTIFGELVACKMRMLRTENAQNMVEHIIYNTLFEASMGKYDHTG